MPPKSNDQRQVPTTSNGRRGIEMSATQQALRRTEGLSVVLSDGQRGHVGRPDLLGSMIIKAAASIADCRNPARH